MSFDPAPAADPSGQTQELAHTAGLVERVTFHNEANGFCVLRLKVKGERDLVTLVGHAASVHPGEWITAGGIWIVDKEYGRQFKAKFLKVHPPTTLSGIEKYLGSGMVKGIGPGFAKRLVKAFGKEVFEVIETDPDKLYTVDGIGPKRYRKIVTGWADQKAVREIMVFLHSHGVSTSRAVRIYKTYGQAAIETVKENPYRLAQDIRGIGFKSADTIAQNLGIDPHADIRARSGLTYTLGQASNNAGHCALPRSELVKQAVELLSIPEEIIERAIDHELAGRTLIADDVPTPDAIYPAPLFLAERSIAANIRRLQSQACPWPAIAVDRALAWSEKKQGITLAQSQRDAVALALKSKVTVITGGPGVGKTTLVKTILTILQAKHVKTLLCAPTGRAAKRLAESSGCEAKTIHRMLEVNPADGQFKRNDENPLECDLLVVDECSMVDVMLANALVKAVPTGAAVIFVGDADQLPSVGPGAFLTDMIESGAVAVVRLTEVFRQAAASWIIRVAHRINRGFMPQFPKAGDRGDCYFVTVDDASQVAHTIVDLVKTRLPRAYGYDPIADIQVLCPMNRSESGARALNVELQKALNAPGEAAIVQFGTTFGVGDKVMQIENNYDRDVFNGDIGLVTKVDHDEGELTVDFDGRSVVYPFGELDELVLCYATTIHKSQGSEYPVVVIPLTTQHYMMLQRNLVYTGVTRGKKLVVLVGQKRALAIAVHAKQASVRNTGLRFRLR